MRSYSWSVEKVGGLAFVLTQASQKTERKTSSAVLVHVFSYTHNQHQIQAVCQEIHEALPEAVIAGTSTTGEICSGKSSENTIVITVTFFSSTRITHFFYDKKRESPSDGGKRLLSLAQAVPELAGIEIIGTLQDITVEPVLAELDKIPSGIPVFGGGAGAYIYNGKMAVFIDDECSSSGMIAVIYSGHDLHIELETCTGWQQLGRSMTVTKVSDSMTIDELDDQKAVTIYEKYLRVRNDEHFFENALEFPLVLNRSGRLLSRVPGRCTPEGSLVLSLNVQTGDKVRLAFGNPSYILDNVRALWQKMAHFAPQSILLFDCCCRKIFLQENTHLEVEPFEQIAPVSGFFTYGEIVRQDSVTDVQNMTMVAVGMREGDDNSDKEIVNTCSMKTEGNVIPLVDRLANFINATTHELEESNTKFAHLAATDRLTQLYNRGEIEYQMEQSLASVGSTVTCMSVIMIDIDNFKHLNDTYGHDAGDRALKTMAATLRSTVRRTDPVGRWGGDEFMVVLAGANADVAQRVAEKIRSAIQSADFGLGCSVSVSIGAAQAENFEDKSKLYRRVDEALYQAKAGGKNSVKVSG